jgi:hypothetical protein
MISRTFLPSNYKYSWQQSVVDALLESDPQRLPDKVTDAQKAVSERLLQERADPDEQLALRGAVIVLEGLRQAPAVGEDYMS